ncbi:NUDIX domain-containing protein [Streptomyces sp. NPDC014733]|uniref:NUDIX domain-containing protein n=1 Tax=Streptomyces sp. NPDC014733 TaxID=3364885 RepID=UPI0036FCB58D
MSDPRPVPERVPEHPRMTQAEYARSRHAVWLGTSVLFTDVLGRILLVKPVYRREWLLAGGAVDSGESPAAAAAREVAEELGLVRRPGRLLATHFLPPGHPDVARDLPFPGEVRYVYDGGVLTAPDIAALRLPADELADFAFLDADDAAERMIPVDAEIVRAALRAQLSGTTAELASGRHAGVVPPLDRHQLLPRLRPGHDWPWHTGAVPAGMPVVQAWGWLFVPDGRVVVVADPGKRRPMLPGGTVEASDGSPEDTLRREAEEEARLTVGEIARLGWVHDATGAVYGGIGECARLRLAAPVTAVGPASADPATGRHFARLLASPQQAAALLGQGAQGRQQAALAARIAHERWGIPHATPAPVTELSM